MSNIVPFCRDCNRYVYLTAFAGGEELACAECEGDNWFFDNNAPASTPAACAAIARAKGERGSDDLCAHTMLSTEQNGLRCCDCGALFANEAEVELAREKGEQL